MPVRRLMLDLLCVDIGGFDCEFVESEMVLFGRFMSNIWFDSFCLI